MNHILITKDNYEDFSSVLPISALPENDRITIGAYTDEGVVCGAISFALNDCQYDIDWLYVSPSVRRQKIATGLVDELFAFIKKTGLVYPVSAMYEVSAKDDSLYSFFFERIDMDTEYAHLRYYVSPGELASSEGLKKNVEIELEDREFFSLPLKEQNSYLSQITADHLYLIEDRNAFEGVCIPRLSRVVVKEGKLMAGIFIMGRNDGNLELSYLYGANPIATKMITSKVAEDITKHYPGAKLIFDCVSDKAEPMASKLFPESKTVYIYESTWL